ncbi:hypothetical protein F4811DRAFT_549801 [Daldinia bambusicola]|nr:hypothetical protein F4811DRAFT_549801 [Daldinia bambusicola]
MAFNRVPKTIAEEYLQILLIDLPGFAKVGKSTQQERLREVIKALKEPVGDIRQELSRCLSRHAHFLALDRSSQLQYISHLHFFFYTGPTHNSLLLLNVLFQLPKLSDYIYTTRPGGEYNPTTNGTSNWFLWDLWRRGLELPSLSQSVSQDHAYYRQDDR